MFVFIRRCKIPIQLFSSVVQVNSKQFLKPNISTSKVIVASKLPDSGGAITHLILSAKPAPPTYIPYRFSLLWNSLPNFSLYFHSAIHGVENKVWRSEKFVPRWVLLMYFARILRGPFAQVFSRSLLWLCSKKGQGRWLHVFKIFVESVYPHSNDAKYVFRHNDWNRDRPLPGTIPKMETAPCQKLILSLIKLKKRATSGRTKSWCLNGSDC